MKQKKRIHLSQILCLFGFHKYKTKVWARLRTHVWTERVCVRCEYSPTWDR